MTSKSPSQALPTNGLHLRTCHLCEAMCGLELEVQEGRVTSLRGDKNDPFSQGHLCPKAMGLLDLHEDPDRLTRPQIREGNRFREASWEEAFALVVDRIGNLQEKYGRNAFAVYQGNPTVHNYGTMLMVTLFDGALRTKNRYSATSLDQLPHMLAALEMFGHQLALPIPDIDNTDFLLMLGANPVASNGSLMSAPNIKGKLQKIISRGGRVLVVDPRRTETAELASEHVFLRPGTDALFLFALLHALFDEGLARPGRLLPLLDGFEDIVTLAAPFTPEQVAPYTGVPATTIRSIARSFAAAPRAACYGRIGISTQRFGGLSCWLVNVLNIVSGNLDRVGGVLFTKPAVDVVGLSAKVGQKGHFGVRKSRVRGLPEFGGEFPSAALAEEIETPGAGQIRGLLTSCGNPVLSAPHGQRLDRALAGLEFMVSVDIYLNETTRHAHVILPPTFGLEHDHYDLIFHALAVRNTAKYSPALFPKSPDARHDWEIFLALTTGLLARRGWRSRAKALAQDAVVKALGPSGILDVLLRSGPYGDKFLPGLDGMSLAKLKATPHGIDLGALQPSLPSSLHTANKRISLVPEVFRKDIPRLAAGLASPPPPPETLLLIGRRDLRSNNSWMHNSTRLVKGPERCTLRMHPTDATPRGIKHGEKARIQSATGTIEATAELSDEIMPGVVSLPHGWGHHRSGTQWRVAEAHAGVSLNDITDDQLVDDLTGNAAFSGVPVQVAGATTSSESPPLAPS